MNSKKPFALEPLWSDLVKSSGIEKQEALRMSDWNLRQVECLRGQAKEARQRSEELRPGKLKWGNQTWQRCLKIAIRCERQARIRAERAEQWRRIAKGIPYPS
jgi:hypothetical protein